MCTLIYKHVYACTHTYAHTLTQTYTHTHILTPKNTYLYIQKNISRTQRFSRTINSNGTFTDINPKIIKDHMQSK